MTQARFSVERLQTTPARLRTWSVVLSFLLGISAILSVLAAQDLNRSAAELRDNTGPVAIETQGLVASIAEADAASTSVFLSGIDGGTEDLQQRGLYERAINRAPRQIESVSSRLPVDDPAHQPLQTAGAQLTGYAGTVERARVLNNQGLGEQAQAELREALLLAGGEGGMLENVGLVNAQNQARLETGVEASTTLVFAAAVALAATILALLFAQFRLRKLTKRAFNPGLVGATIAAVAALAWIGLSTGTMVVDLNRAATDGFDSIELVGALQTEAFAFRTNESLAIIGAQDFSQMDRNESLAVVSGLLNEVNLAADSLREQSAFNLLETRWDRYVETSDAIDEQLGLGNGPAARALAIEASNDDFNGFNTTLEAILLSNRDQFDLGVQSANERLRFLTIAMVLLPLLGAALVLAGYQPRINEYW